MIESDTPIVVEHTRLDSRRAESALRTTIAFSMGVSPAEAGLFFTIPQARARARRMTGGACTSRDRCGACKAGSREDLVPGTSKLHLLVCAIALAPVGCASRGREVATPPAAAPADPAAPAASTPRDPQRREGAGAPAPATARVEPRAADPAQMREHVGRLQDLVASLARERDWAAARDAAAEALRAISDAVAVAPAAADRARVAVLASAVRAEAVQLAGTDPTSLERADLARAGLLAAAAALEELAAPPDGSLLARMLASARAAAGAIDVHSPFVFERAQIQDAFRAAADAFLVFAERARAPAVGRR